MEEDLRALLIADAAIAALAGTRVRWVKRKQGDALPGITLRNVPVPRGAYTDGPDAIAKRRVHVDCWGRTYLEAKTLARAVEALLHGRSLRNKPGALIAAFLDGDLDFDEGEAPEQIYRTTLDFRVWHTLPQGG